MVGMEVGGFMKRYLYIKNILDLIFASLLIILASPIMLFAALAIKIEDFKGPVFFSQIRPGQNGKIFRIYKFRTMKVVTQDAYGNELTDMERMTKSGSFLRKTSIDELPQLFNIIKGDMSFIGPRPLLVQYLQYYNKEQKRRHQVKPGITGWAQVNGRNAITWAEKFDLDVWYVDHVSIKLDFKIIVKTIVNVISRKDINNSDANTMPFFRGE